MFTKKMLITIIIAIIHLQSSTLSAMMAPQPDDPDQPGKTSQMEKMVKSIRTKEDGERTVASLIADLKNKSYIIRKHASKLLGDIGKDERSKEALKELAEKDLNLEVKWAAKFNLLRVEVATAESEKDKKGILLNDLKDIVNKKGRGSLWTIGQIADLGIAEAVPELEKLIVPGSHYYHDDDKIHVTTAIKKINYLNSASTKSEAYTKAVQSDDNKIKVWGLERLGELGDKAAISVLQEEKKRIEDKYFYPPIFGKRQPKVSPTERKGDDVYLYRAAVNSLKKLGIDLKEGTPGGFAPDLYYIDDK